MVLRSDVRSVRRAIAAGDIPAQPVGPRKLVPGRVAAPGPPGWKRARPVTRTGLCPKPRPPAERTGLDVPSIGTDPSRGTSPRADTGNAAGQGAAGAGQTVPCQRDPVALATALAELLELCDERDQWMDRLGDEYRLGWKLGYAAGVDEGRRLEAEERDGAWNRVAGPIARGGDSHAELERRRWGPGGRLRFGDPRPGDRFGRQEGAA